jgi:hypothetical protein
MLSRRKNRRLSQPAAASLKKTVGYEHLEAVDAVCNIARNFERHSAATLYVFISTSRFSELEALSALVSVRAQATKRERVVASVAVRLQQIASRLQSLCGAAIVRDQGFAHLVLG